MHERTISQYALTELAKSENISFAIADKDQKISWCSKGFKSNFTSKRIIGTTLVKLFDLTSPNDLSDNKKKSFNVNLPGKNKSATISCLISKNKTTGYFVEIEQIEKPKKNDGRESSRLNKDLQSPKELQQILTLLVKEKSLTNLTEEILKDLPI